MVYYYYEITSNNGDVICREEYPDENTRNVMLEYAVKTCKEKYGENGFQFTFGTTQRNIHI